MKKKHLNFAASYILGTQNNGKWKFSEKIYRYFPVGETRAGSPTQFEKYVEQESFVSKEEWILFECIDNSRVTEGHKFLECQTFFKKTIGDFFRDVEYLKRPEFSDYNLIRGVTFGINFKKKGKLEEANYPNTQVVKWFADRDINASKNISMRGIFC